MNITHNYSASPELTTGSSKIIQTLGVLFDATAKPWELENILQNMAKRIDASQAWFHNHINSNSLSNGHLSYPLLQFKCNNQHPYLLCFSDTSEDAHQFFTNNYNQLREGQEDTLPALQSMDKKFHNMRLWDGITFNYHIFNYAVMEANTQEAATFQAKLPLVKNRFIEHHVAKKLLDFTAAMGWRVEGRIKINILKLGDAKQLKHHNTRQESVSFTFSSNLFLPDFTGIGTGAEHGMGIVRHLKGKKD